MSRVFTGSKLSAINQMLVEYLSANLQELEFGKGNVTKKRWYTDFLEEVEWG